MLISNKIDYSQTKMTLIFKLKNPNFLILKNKFKKEKNKENNYI